MLLLQLKIQSSNSIFIIIILSANIVNLKRFILILNHFVVQIIYLKKYIVYGIFNVHLYLYETYM